MQKNLLGEESKTVLQGYELPILGQNIGLRTAFAQSLAQGKSAISRAGEGRTEVQGLVKEILKMSR
ncbi:hypothetical protein D3C80_2162050 [compost metagenome]